MNTLQGTSDLQSPTNAAMIAATFNQEYKTTTQKIRIIEN